MNALVVDGVVSTRKFIRSVLKDLHFQEVFEVSDGQQALKVLKEEDVNLIISDWTLEGISGLDLLKRVRNHTGNDAPFGNAASQIKDLPFILLSGHTDKSKLLQAINAKVSEFVVKPYTAELLSEKIKACLNKKK